MALKGFGPEARRYAGAALLLVAMGLLTAVGFGPGGQAATVHATAGAWALTGWRSIAARRSDQGLATVKLPDDSDRVLMRGDADVPAQMQAWGWRHIGDPGSAHGYLLDAYQGTPGMDAKLFVLTAPDGRRSEYIHRLTPGEMINNSFASVEPSGRWFVSGEWGTITRLLEFPMPGLDAAARQGHDLPLAGTIGPTRPVQNVQGCAFASATRLMCATNDPNDVLFGGARELIAVKLQHPLDGRSQLGVPVPLGTVSQVSGCGTAETEGIDIHGSTTLVTAREPGLCGGRSDVFSYVLQPGVGVTTTAAAPSATSRRS